MTKFKKAAVILAVMFAAGFGAGVVIFNVVADMAQETIKANNEGG